MKPKSSTTVNLCQKSGGYQLVCRAQDFGYLRPGSFLPLLHKGRQNDQAEIRSQSWSDQLPFGPHPSGADSPADCGPVHSVHRRWICRMLSRAGERDPYVLADFARGRMVNIRAALIEALNGRGVARPVVIR